MAVTVSVGPFAFVLSLLSRNLLDSVLERKSELKAQFFFPKRKRELTFEHGAKRRRSKSPEQGVEDLSGGHRREALGGICLSRRRYSCARAAPWDETTSAVGGPSSEILRGEHQRMGIHNGCISERVSRIGVPPLERKRPEEEEWF